MRSSLILLSALASSSTCALAGLAAYDDKIAADHAAGLAYVAISTATLEFDGSNSEPFDFGPVSGSSTIEFIVSGDPVAGGQNGFLGVGSNGTWSLRYEQWNDTGQLGFTHGGVADYVFNPPPAAGPVPASDSPTDLTHVTYRWDDTTSTMELYLNGSLEGNRSAPGFQFPSGAGFLGNNAALSEGMLGTIERAAVYNEAVDPAVILAHAEAWNGPGGSLANYDTVIATDHAGALPYTAFSGSTLNFDTTNSEPFDAGVITGSATAEFILSGDPVAGGQDGYLLVGSDPLYSLRYEQWNDTGKLGFTHGGVADYLFVDPDLPPVPSTESPTEPTHVVYRWDQATTTMELYLDGVLAGVNSAATGFQMPTGSGFLGNNAGSSEGMLGVMERVTVYDEALSVEDIIAHAKAWLGEQAFTMVVTSDGTNLTFTWPSRSGKVYDLLSETDPSTPPATWPVFMGHEAIPATPDENSFTIPRPGDGERFFVIQERPAPPIFEEDFESGQGEWVLGQTDVVRATAWEIGEPDPNALNGPLSAAGGSGSCLGTNLGGNYGSDSDIFAHSPAFMVGSGGACVTFMQYRDTDLAADYGFVRVLDAVTGTRLGDDVAMNVEGADIEWMEFTADLPPEASDRMVRLEFQFVSDDSLWFGGWFLDDIAVLPK